jgi:hypothetical protein
VPGSEIEHPYCVPNVCAVKAALMPVDAKSPNPLNPNDPDLRPATYSSNPPEASVVLLYTAAVAGVSVQPVSRFRMGAGPDGILLGFGGIPAEQIPDGLRTLAQAVERVVELARARTRA